MKTKEDQTSLEKSTPEKLRKTKKGERKQGDMADPKALRSKGADDFAHAVGKIMEQAKALKGSQREGFLGVESEILNPTEYTKREASLNVKKRTNKHKAE